LHRGRCAMTHNRFRDALAERQVVVRRAREGRHGTRQSDLPVVVSRGVELIAVSLSHRLQGLFRPRLD
jgi:hypothetical protein